jgi:type I restriction enzyme S subunit
VSEGLPVGWVNVPLRDVVDVHDARRVPVNADERAKRVGSYPYYGANGQAGTIDDFLFDGDFALLAEDGGNFDEPSRGVAYRVTGRFWVNNHAHILAPRLGMETRFLVPALNAIDWMPYVSGTTRLKLTQGAMMKVPFRLPPLNEQRRIVAKLEALQARSRRARETLDAVPPLLEKLRQSILAAAFRGDLTKDWRTKHKDVEPASELLKRIRAERRKKWEEGELAKMTAKGKPPTDDRWKTKYKELEPVDTTGLPELPEGWTWAPLGSLGADPWSAVQTGPFGAMLHNTEFVVSGVPVIAVGNLTGLGFRREGLYFVTAEKAKQLERFDVQAGDVLFARSGATTGKVCVAPSYVRNWRMTGHILRLRLNTEALRPDVAVFALAGAPAVKAQIAGNIRGATRPGYNTGLLESIRVPLPPLLEQEALVDVLTGILTAVENGHSAHHARLLQLSELERSLLAKAFRGELVPQDPNDEPAEAMLARIRGTNGASASNQAKQKGRANSKKPVRAEAVEE